LSRICLCLAQDPIHSLRIKAGEEAAEIAGWVPGGRAVPVDQNGPLGAKDHLIGAEVAMDQPRADVFVLQRFHSGAHEGTSPSREDRMKDLQRGETVLQRPGVLLRSLTARDPERPAVQLGEAVAGALEILGRRSVAGRGAERSALYPTGRQHVPVKIKAKKWVLISAEN
jgi:hypothetical protein